MKMRMSGWIGSSLLLVMLPGCADRDVASAPPPDHVLVDVTVIDGTGAMPLPGQTVEITGRLLSDLEPPLVQAIAEAARAEGLRVWSHAAAFPTRPSAVVASGVDVISHAAFLVWEVPAELPRTYNDPHPWNVFGPPAPYTTVGQLTPRMGRSVFVSTLQAGLRAESLRQARS